MDKRTLRIFGASILALSVFAISKVSFAATSNTAHVVTVIVPSVVSLQADTANFTLTFPDYISGTVTDQKVVTYTIKANNVTKTVGVVQAQLSAAFTNVTFQASAGTYTKNGGNANLVATTSGFVTVANLSATSLYNRQTVSGTGSVLLGTFPVTYQAKAAADLSPATTTSTLTVTFIDT